MKKIIFALILLLAALADMSAQTKTIFRTDTVVHYDTIVRRSVVERREIIYRTDSMLDNVAFPIGHEPENTHKPMGPKDLKDPKDPKDPKDFKDVKDLKVIKPVEQPLVTTEATQPVAVNADTVTVHNPIRGSGGSYVWIPDSMRARLADYFAEKNGPDINEKTLFRGDTVPMYLKDRNLGRFNRGLFNHLFIPKGIWQFGATASYGEFSTSDLEVFDLLTDINFSGHMFSVRPYFSYFIKSNTSVGMRLGYTSGRANIDSFKVDIDDDMNFDLHDICYRSESYTAAITFNQYYGIARRGRFAIFNEVELAFSSGNSNFIRPFNGVLKDTHTTTMKAALNFSPGVSVFIMDPVSFQISFGVFGLSVRSDKQTVDGEELGTRVTSGANFRFNIFNIAFGIAVNL